MAWSRIGRGRGLAVVSAVVMLVGCLLPWYAVGGGADLPLRQLNGFSGSGILVFVAAVATLAIVTLPWAAAGTGVHVAVIDRWPAYGLAVIAAWVGLLYWVVSLAGEVAAGLFPGQAPGLWIAIVGTLGLTRAAYDIFREAAPR